jgi:hypothetical protein
VRPSSPISQQDQEVGDADITVDVHDVTSPRLQFAEVIAIYRSLIGRLRSLSRPARRSLISQCYHCVSAGISGMPAGLLDSGHVTAHQPRLIPAKGTTQINRWRRCLGPCESLRVARRLASPLCCVRRCAFALEILRAGVGGSYSYPEPQEAISAAAPTEQTQAVEPAAAGPEGPKIR